MPPPPLSTLPAVLAVAVGGALGSAGRYAVSALTGPPLDEVVARAAFPWSTLLVNLTGALALGALAAAAALPPRAARRPWLVPLLGPGLLGGWTTFSTLSAEVVGLLRAGAPALAAAYVVTSVALGGAAVVAGSAAGSRWRR